MFELFLVISCLQPDFPEHASEVKLSDLFFLSGLFLLISGCAAAGTNCPCFQYFTQHS
eukprot:m.364697 g.364697  ORF g.364697 m.364697 type:complete len:58 (+) comp56042_c0_seq19:318-491(+)